eukprot:gene25859-11531_t
MSFCYKKLDVLHNTSAGSDLQSDDNNLLHALLLHHPCAEQKIGLGVSSFCVDGAPMGQLSSPKTRCIWVKRVDGTTTDLSYLKHDASRVPTSTCRSYLGLASEADTIHQLQAAFDDLDIHQNCGTTVDARNSQGRYSRSEVLKAMRYAIAPQCINYKRRMFSAKGSVVCLATGEYLTPSTSEVDHAWPNTFQVLSNRFIGSLGPKLQREDLTPSTSEVDHAWPSTFQVLSNRFIESLEPKLQRNLHHLHCSDNSITSLHPSIAHKWEEFHEKHAKLRLLSKKGHM